MKITKKSGKASYVFQQDDAPAHTAGIVQTWMEENMKFWPKNFWPPQSPDLNPLDYSIWWHVESKACRNCHSNIDSLKSSVEKEWRKMSKEYVTNVCTAFRGHLEAIIAANGVHIHK